MFLFVLLCIAAAVAVFCRDLPIGKQVRSLLFDAPAHLLAKLTWAKVLVSVALLTIFVGAVFLAFNMHDGVVIFMMLPEVLVWLAAFDIATLLELSVVAMFAVASIRVDAAVRFVAERMASFANSMVRRSARPARGRRSKPRDAARGAADEDGPDPVWGCAFA